MNQKLDFHPADRPALVAALGGFAAQMEWNLTCTAASAAERELSAHYLASTRRMLAFLDEPTPPVTFGDAARKRITESGADPWALMAILSTEPGGDPQRTYASRVDEVTDRFPR